jgi:hypothetical protein
MTKLLAANQHAVERALRIILGLALLTLAFVGPKTPAGYLGIIPLATGFVGVCPLYSLIGFSTRRSGRS